MIQNRKQKKINNGDIYNHVNVVGAKLSGEQKTKIKKSYLNMRKRTL